ncbi:MAG TPA: hypothetical protein VFI40_04725 [Nocardioides sp.]|nr:hypothetical protein [Nocardioides sp.]
MTFELKRDLPRGRWDGRYFAKAFLGIDLHPGQVEMFNAYLKRSKGGWRAQYLWLMIAAGNRAGKTMALAVIILHACFYKMGQKPLDPASEASIKNWLAAPFMWFHFALQQENAELVWSELEMMLNGRHPAQKGRGCPLVDTMGLENVLAQPLDRKYRGDYAWIKLHENLGGAEVHFRSVAEKALGSLGRDMHGVSFDEVGLIGAKLPFILNEVLHFRRLGTGGPFILISTPSEDIGPEFADLWYTGDRESGDYQPRRLSMRMSSRDNVGFGLDRDTFEAMIAGMDESIVLQNIDGYFIQGRSAYFNAASVNAAFRDWLPGRLRALRGHAYSQGVDPAKSHDSAWSIVLDVLMDRKTELPIAVGVYAEQRRGKLTTPQLVDLAAGPHNAYANLGVRSTCSTAIDATGFGGKMFKEALEEEVPVVRSIEFGGSLQKKRKLLGDVRTMLDEGRLLLPKTGLWLKVRRQLLGYKLDDKNIEQDAVMALACAIAEVHRLAGAGGAALRFDFYGTDADLPLTDGRRWSRTPYEHAPRGAA